MFKKEKIDRYIDQVPALPKTLKECYSALLEEDLGKAAQAAANDPAFTHFLKSLTKKSIYGFAREISDVRQIFAVLGLATARSVVENYLFSMLAPDRFQVFDLTVSQFQELQDEMLVAWLKILAAKGHGRNSPYATLAPLMTASVVVCESLFADMAEDAALIRGQNDLDFDTLLKRMTGIGLIDVAIMVAQRWEVDSKCTDILSILAHAPSQTVDPADEAIARYLHLTLFFVLSQKRYMEAGLNDFIDLDDQFVAPIVEDFQKVMMDDAADH